jgi:benzodiazapine receptor
MADGAALGSPAATAEVRKKTRRPVIGLVGWLALCMAAGGLGAIASTDAPTFYAQLARPSWAPPASLFGPVWSVLYVMMGCAAWLVWRRWGFRGAAPALGLFVAQLAFNALWSWLFFGWHHGAAAMADIALMAVLIVATIVAFWPLHRVAALLLVPYLLWVTFAGVLNWTLWRANPTLLG